MDNSFTIEKIEKADNLSLPDFCDRFLAVGRPCILSSEFTADWHSRKDWIGNGKPNFDFLLSNYAEDVVPVVNCGCQYFNSQEKCDMPFKDFIKYWKDLLSQSGHSEKEKNAVQHDILYLKDWHFQKKYSDYKAYEVPYYFQSDWLNEYWDQRTDVQDDYRFVYMGPRGSWTPFHADVFRSFSWSANICGKKKWLLFPPGEEEKLKDVHGSLPFDVTSKDMLDTTRYPRFRQCSTPLVVIQNEGEIIFVPSGWHHQVHNLEDTISINHNWTNAYGIHNMWNHLRSELALVKHEIRDCQDMDGWHQQCQVILKANSGIDYQDFLFMLYKLRTPRRMVIARIHEFVLNLSEDRIVSTENLLARFRITSTPSSHLSVNLEELTHPKTTSALDDSLDEIILAFNGFPRITEFLRILFFDLKQLDFILNEMACDIDAKNTIAESIIYEKKLS